ncbi:unnamed protein product [Schistosoma mattheei]|uniref:Uncharacterized protein n=1 Tax=Schistosoma mattheei TaxID=31246 RepID=A0AA85BXM6_9TREM|nr:unnamed protein product [Schistosoma mattheei]
MRFIQTLDKISIPEVCSVNNKYYQHIMFEVLLPLIVGLIWGSTNICMKYNSNKMLKLLAFFFLNQFASILLMFGFGYTRLSRGVAIANSTALLASALTSSCVYHEKMKFSGSVGVVLICVGTGLLNS